MRIVAGSARSRTLLTPPGRDTRPTLDRVRENLFNILQFQCPQARVLDLFAGSGALSMEALSRGAQSAVLVDISAQAHKIQIQNAQNLGFFEQCRILHVDWKKALELLAAEQAVFDLVFLDPPYKLTDLSQVTQLMAKKGLIHEDSLVIVEHDFKEQITVCPALSLQKQRKYGIVGVSIYQLSPE